MHLLKLLEIDMCLFYFYKLENYFRGVIYYISHRISQNSVRVVKLSNFKMQDEYRKIKTKYMLYKMYTMKC